MTSTLLEAIKLVLMYARVLVLNVSITLTLLRKEVIMFEKLNPELFFCNIDTKTQTFCIEKLFYFQKQIQAFMSMAGGTYLLH